MPDRSEPLERRESSPLASLGPRLYRSDTLFALAVLFGIICLAFYEIVFGGKTMLSANTAGVMGSEGGVYGDPWGYSGAHVVDAYRLDRGGSAWAVEPAIQKIHQLYKKLRLPLWSANSGTGMPLMADMQSAPFNPLRLGIFIEPSPLLWDMYYLGRILFGGLFAFLFARALTLSRPSGLVVAVGYILSGFLMLYSNNGFLDVYFTLPLVLFATELCVLRLRARYSLLLAVAVAFNLFAGLPEASFVTLLLAGGYALYRLVSSRVEEGTWYSFRPRLGYLAVGFGAGALLAMPELLPFVEYLQHSFSTHHAGTVGLTHELPKFSANLLVPYIDGPPGLSVSSSGFSGTRNYVGLVLPLLALIGLWHRPLGLRAGWFFAGAALLGLLKTYGFLPINELGRLPVANLVIFGQWLGPVNAFCIALCAGIGVERVFRGDRLGWTLPVAAGGLLLILFVLLAQNWDIVSHLKREPRMWLQIGVGLVLLTSFLLWAGERQPQRQGWVCLAMVAAELLLFVPHGIYRDRHDTFEKPPYVAYLQAERPDRGRIYGVNGVLYPNDASAYNLDDVRTLNAIYPDRYFKYLQQFVSRVGDRFVGDAPLVSYSGNPFFNLLGVRYMLTNKAGLSPDTAHPLVDETVARLGKTAQHDLVDYTIAGVKKHALFAHAPSDVQLDLRIGGSERVLKFSAAMDPAVWDNPAVTGVLFEVLAASRGSQPQPVWRRVVDPMHVEADRAWVDGEVDLAPFGLEATVILRTSPAGPSANSNWSAWGDLRLGSPSNLESQFRLIYDHEVRIYENKDALPRAFTVTRLDEVRDGNAALAVMKHPGFDPARQAVIEGRLPNDQRGALASAAAAPPSSVRIKSYRDARVELTAQMQNPGLLVLSDTDYPGWKAYVDGKRVEIHRTDYAFRSVFVPQGTHEVVFKYDPASFKGGVLLALLVVLGFGGWWGYGRYQQRRAQAAAEIPE